MSRHVARAARGCGVLLLAALVGAVVCLAHASPPDPTWIPGLYDDADHDDAILALLAMEAFVVTVTFCAQPGARVEPVVLVEVTRAPARYVDAARSRAPPLSSPA